MPGRVWCHRRLGRAVTAERPAARSTARLAEPLGQRGHQLIAHQRDRRRTHRHHDVAPAGPPQHLARYVLPGRYEHLVPRGEIDRRGQRDAALAGTTMLARPEYLEDHGLIRDRERLGDLGLEVPGAIHAVRLEHHDQLTVAGHVAERLEGCLHRRRVVGVLVEDSYATGGALELEAPAYAGERRERLDDRVDVHAELRGGQHG